jgi:hypothetical protein
MSKQCELDTIALGRWQLPFLQYLGGPKLDVDDAPCRLAPALGTQFLSLLCLITYSLGYLEEKNLLGTISLIGIATYAVRNVVDL